jgi:hypothetical protein
MNQVAYMPRWELVTDNLNYGTLALEKLKIIKRYDKYPYLFYKKKHKYAIAF